MDKILLSQDKVQWRELKISCTCIFINEFDTSKINSPFFKFRGHSVMLWFILVMKFIHKIKLMSIEVLRNDA